MPTIPALPELALDEELELHTNGPCYSFEDFFKPNPIEIYENGRPLTIGKDYIISLNNGVDWLGYFPSDTSCEVLKRNALAGTFLVQIKKKMKTAMYSSSYFICKNQDLDPDKFLKLKNHRIVCGDALKNASGNLYAVIVARSSTRNPYITPVLKNYSLCVQESPGASKQSGKLGSLPLEANPRKKTIDVG